MKKLLVISVIGLVLAVGLAWAAANATGGGKVVSVSKVPTTVTGLTADVVSVYNAGADPIWAQENASATAVSNAAALGTAVPIPANMTYTFDQRDKLQARGQITSVALVTTNTSATAYVGWY